MPEVTDTGLFAEYFGAMLAMAFGIEAPTPAIVNLSTELIEVAAHNLAGWGLSPRPGEAVGLEFLRGLAPLSRLIPVKGPAEIVDAAQIYAFDMLIQNPDRRDDKPNCANLRGRLVAYDHEMAFSFLYPIVGSGRPWEVPSFSQHHVFHRALRSPESKGEIDWTSVRQGLAAVEEQVEGLAQLVPDRWRAHADRVVTHVHEVASHAGVFEEQLRRSLS